MNCSVTLSFGLAAQDATRIPASDNMCDKKSFMTHFSLWATDGEARLEEANRKNVLIPSFLLHLIPACSFVAQ